MMGDYPVGFENQEALREPTPPPVVERLPGYLEVTTGTGRERWRRKERGRRRAIVREEVPLL